MLAGGFVTNRIYLIEGIPGAGKTTLALQFLLEGVRRGERVLYVTLSETESGTPRGVHVKLQNPSLDRAAGDPSRNTNVGT